MPAPRFLARITRTIGSVLAPLLGSGRFYGLPIVREPFAGAWQQNQEVRSETVLAYFAVFSCTTLIATDIAKLRLRLVALDENGIWTETSSSAFSPVLRKPNRYQNTLFFLQSWITSKLIAGNTYVLKERDDRGVVKALYPLDPCKVTPLITPDGQIYYQLGRDDLNTITADSDLVLEGAVVPAREIIHDQMCALFHPLIGVSPIYACGLAALQGLKIQSSSTNFFANGSSPGGVLLAPTAISDETAARLKEYWEANYTGANVGKVAVLGDNLKYEPLSVSAVDSQLIEQLKWTAETVCSCYHVPPYMIGVGGYPPYANGEPLLQLYYSQCLQGLIVALETCLDEGLELPAPFGTELDIDDLIWMDSGSRTKAAGDSIGSGALSPDEARKKYFGLGPVPGGDSPYLQQQYYSLAALAARDELSSAPPTAPPDEDVFDLAAFVGALRLKTATLKAAAAGGGAHGE